MAWQHSSYSLPLLVSAALSVALAFFAWRRRTPDSAVFALLMLAVAEWSAGYALELASASQTYQLFWAKFQYLGIGTAPVLWLIYVCDYTGLTRRLPPHSLLLLLIVPAITVLLAWTNDLHFLLWSEVGQESSGSFVVLDLTHGPWFWVHTAYSYLVLLSGTVMLIRTLLRSPRPYSGQAGALLIGALAPWVGNAVYIFDLSPFPHLDLTPFAFTLTGLSLAWGASRFRLLSIVPAARDTVVEGKPDGVVVVDVQGRIVDLNPAAKRIIGFPASQVVGRPVDQVLPMWPRLVERHHGEAEMRERIVLDEGGAQRTYDLSVTPLRDRRDRLIGQLAVFRDVTELERAGKELGARERFLTLLNDITSAALSTPDLSTMAQILADRMAELIDADGCYITLWDEASKRAIPAAAYGEMREVYPLLRPQPDDVTVTKSVLRAGHPLVIEDVFNTPYLSRRIAEMFPTRSLLALPLIAGDRGLGAALFAFNESHHFTAEEIARGEQAAGQIALALAKSRLLEEAQARWHEAETLRQAGAAVTEILSLDETLGRILEQLERVVPFDDASIQLLQDGCLEIVSGRGFSQPEMIVGLRIPVPGDNPNTAVVERREPVVLADAQAAYHLFREPPHAHVRSWLGVPLIVHGQMIGILAVDSVEPDHFTEEHIRLVTPFANQVAVAIENARLYERLQEELNEKESLLEAAAAVSSSLDLGSVLLALAGQLLRVSGFHNCTISEWDQGGDRVRTLAEHTHCVWPVGGGDYYRLADYPMTDQVLTTGQYKAVYIGVDDPESDLMREIGLSAMLMLPLRGGGETIGLVELGSPQPDFIFQEEDVRHYQRVLEEASSSLISPLRANPDGMLLALARQLVESGSVSWCSISDWHRRDGTVCTVAEHADLNWASGRGPSYPLADWPSAARALLEGVQTVQRVSDPDCLAGDRADMTRWGARTMVMLPLSVREEVIGLVEIYDFAEEKVVSEAQLRMWQAVADQAAVAVENARLYERARRRARELAVLYETASAAMTSVHVDEVLGHTIAVLREMLRADSIAILLIEPESGELVICAFSGFPGGPKLVRRAVGVGIPGWVVQTGQPVLLNDVRSDERYRACDSDTISELCVPLQVGEQTIGALNLESRRWGTFGEEDLHLLSILAGQLAALIDNARLYEEMSRLKAFNEHIVQTMTEGIVIEDAQGYFSFVNPAAAAMLGYEVEELVGRHWTMIVPPDQQPIIRAADERRQRGESDSYEAELISRDGARVSVLISGSPQFEKGGFTGTLAVFTDITKRKQGEQERERLIEELDAFAHTVAHDLKDPLALVVGSAETLEQICGTISKQELRQWLQKIAAGGRRMGHIVDELLLLAGARSEDVEMEPLDMARIVAEVQQRLAHVIEEHGAEIILPDAWPAVVGYGPWVEEIWANYISNAIKYGGQPPRIELGAEQRPDGQVCLWVRDNGAGLVPEERARLFTPSTRADQRGGHGLGLSIVQRIVQRLGGQVGVESEAGRGSVFTFTLPGVADSTDSS